MSLGSYSKKAAKLGKRKIFTPTREKSIFSFLSVGLKAALKTLCQSPSVDIFNS